MSGQPFITSASGKMTRDVRRSVLNSAADHIGESGGESMQETEAAFDIQLHARWDASGVGYRPSR